jgi:hypothetical protein
VLGDAIVDVQMNVWWRGSSSSSTEELHVDYSVDGTTTGLVNPDHFFTNPYDYWSTEASFTLPPPPGGWTWAKVTAIRFGLFSGNPGGGPAKTNYIDHVEFEVHHLVYCSPTNTPTPTATPTRTMSGTSTPTYTLSPTPSPSGSCTFTRTVSPSPTSTITFTATPTLTPSSSATLTASSSATPSFSATSTALGSATDTPTASATSTPGPSSTITLTFSKTSTPLPPPPKFKLVTVYPNPIGPTGAHFVLSMPRPGTVRFWLYDLRGELIWTGTQEYPAGGNYQYDWPATNNFGAAISYGAYYLRAKADYTGGGGEQDGKWLTVLR